GGGVQRTARQVRHAVRSRVRRGAHPRYRAAGRALRPRVRAEPPRVRGGAAGCRRRVGRTGRPPRLGNGRRVNARPAARLVALEVGVVGAVVVLMLTAILGWEVAEFAALALLLAGTLLLDVHLPWGGSVPTGYALVIALAELMTFDRFGIVAGLALGVCVPVLLARHDPRETARRLVWWALPALTAGATAHLLRGVQWQVQEPESSLVQVLVTGAAFVLADLAVRRLLTASDRSERVSVASAWPVHLSLVCAAALIAMAYRYRHGGLWMAGMAALPLFITRFSFERYAAARRTYDQMIQALGIVPEVAGLTTPGHGERTAVYAGALAD